MLENEVAAGGIEISVNSAIERFRVVLLAVLIIAIAGILGVIASILIHGKSVSSGIEAIDTIEFVLLKDAASLSGDELAKKQDTALSQLLPLSNKGGAVGARASLLLADIYFRLIFAWQIFAKTHIHLRFRFSMRAFAASSWATWILRFLITRARQKTMNFR